jgi:hypothetical protein
MPSMPKETSSHLSTDQDDEALNRWKASLGLGTGQSISDPNDPRLCIIKSLALVRDPRSQHIPIQPTDTKDPYSKSMADPT